MESDSRAATTIADGPPNIKNARKTDASEKLIANRDLGRARLIRGATMVEKARINRKPQLIVFAGRSASAKKKQAPPAAIIIHFAIFERESLFIKAGQGEQNRRVLRDAGLSGAQLSSEFNTFNV